MLWLALAGKNSGQRPSGLLGIKNEVVALDFDLACTLRLVEYEREAAKFQANQIAYEVSKIFGGGDQEEEGEAW